MVPLSSFVEVKVYDTVLVNKKIGASLKVCMNDKITGTTVPSWPMT